MFPDNTLHCINMGNSPTPLWVTMVDHDITRKSHHKIYTTEDWSWVSWHEIMIQDLVQEAHSKRLQKDARATRPQRNDERFWWHTDNNTKRPSQETKAMKSQDTIIGHTYGIQLLNLVSTISILQLKICSNFVSGKIVASYSLLSFARSVNISANATNCQCIC